MRALNDAGFDVAPLVRRNQQRNDIDLPGPIGPERIAVDVVRDPVLANAALGTAQRRSSSSGPIARSDSISCSQCGRGVTPSADNLVIGSSEAEGILI